MSPFVNNKTTLSPVPAETWALAGIRLHPNMEILTTLDATDKGNRPVVRSFRYVTDTLEVHAALVLTTGGEFTRNSFYDRADEPSPDFSRASPWENKVTLSFARQAHVLLPGNWIVLVVQDGGFPYLEVIEVASQMGNVPDSAERDFVIKQRLVFTYETAEGEEDDADGDNVGAWYRMAVSRTEQSGDGQREWMMTKLPGSFNLAMRIQPGMAYAVAQTAIPGLNFASPGLQASIAERKVDRGDRQDRQDRQDKSDFRGEF